MESFSDTQEEVEVQNGWLHLSRLQLRSREGIWWFAPWNVTKKESVRLLINFMDLLEFFWWFFPCFSALLSYWSIWSPLMVWSRIRKCSSCRQSYLDHDKRTKKCKRGKGSFTSSYSCSCNSSYDRHCTMVQTQQEREASGKATGTPWMQSAETWTELRNFRVGSSICSMIFLDIFFWYVYLVSPEANAGLPTAHMGGVGGFTSLADGIDRALAGTCTILQMQMIVFFWKI